MWNGPKGRSRTMVLLYVRASFGARFEAMPEPRSPGALVRGPMGCAPEGELKGREGLVLRSLRPKGRRRINSLPRHQLDILIQSSWESREAISSSPD
jgi:hypothetical protein